MFKKIDVVLEPRKKGLTVVMKNDEEFLLDLTYMSGIERLLYILKMYREWQEKEPEITKGFLVPQSLQELEKLYKTCCKTSIAEEAALVIWQGVAKYNNEVHETELNFKEAFGRYHYIYRHPSEPRFSAIKAEKAWKEITENFFRNFGPRVPDPEHPAADIHVLNLKDVLYDLDMFGIKATLSGVKYFQVPESTLEDREFQTSNGCLVKTGKILQHITNTEELSEDKVSIISGYIQEALRIGIAKIDSVKVSKEVGDIYRMGGNFTSCMRGLGARDSFGMDSFQIYKDLGAKIAYMTVPRKNFAGLPVIENGRVAEKLIARAILWDQIHLIKNGEEKQVKIMDTIYRDSVHEQASMIKWARQHGYAYKITECSYSCCRFTYGPDRESEDFSLEEFDDARVYRIDDKVWERGMYERVPWVDLFCNVTPGENYAGFRQSSEAACLHSQEGHGGFLTQIIKCQFCGAHLTSPTEEEQWHEREGKWTCPSCYDTEWTECSECGEEGPKADFVEVDDRWLCPTCENELYTTCDACETRIDREEASYNNDGVPFCEECYSERYTFCARCDNEIYVDDSTYVEEVGSVCNYCIEEHYTQCDNCGNFVEHSSSEEVNITKDHNGLKYKETLTLCLNCRDNLGAEECEECGEIWDTLHPESETIDDPMCTDCFERNYRKCSICGERVPLDKWEENEGLCDSCWHMSY